MTSFITKLWNRLHGRQTPVSIMLIGLDNSGKTSILGGLTRSSWLQRGCSNTDAQTPQPDRSQNCETKDVSNFNSCDNTVTCAVSTHNHDGDGFDDDDDDVDSNNITDQLDARPILMTSDGCTCRNAASDKVKPTVGYDYERINYNGQSLNVLDFSGQSKYRSLWQEFVNCVDGIVFVIDSSDLIRLVVVRDELETILSNPYFDTLQSPTSNLNTSSTGPLVSAQAVTAANNQQQKQIVISQGKLILSPLEGASVSTATRRLHATTATSPISPSTNNDHNQGKAGVYRTKVPILMLAHKTDLSNSIDTEAITRALNLNQLINKSRHPWRIQATSVNTHSGVGVFEGLNWLLSEINAA